MHTHKRLIRATPRSLAALCTSFLALLFSVGSHAADKPAAADAVEGLWASGGSLVQVARTGDSLEMVVVALEEPFDEQGVPFRDTNNPDSSRHDEPILGMNLLSNYVFSGKRWEGKIYDPESGKIYSSRMKVKDGLLEMRGYIGTPMLGKTKKFKPISQCRDDMLVMLNNSGITGYCGIAVPAGAAGGATSAPSADATAQVR